MKKRFRKGMNMSTGENPDRDVADFYATAPEAVRALLHVVNFKGPIWECANGKGHIQNVLKSAGHRVVVTEAFPERYGTGDKKLDFTVATKALAPNLITNPPYSLLNEFIDRSLSLCTGKVALLAPLQAISSMGRLNLYLKHGYPDMYVLAPTLKVPKFDGSILKSAFSHVWLVWPARNRKHGKFQILNWREINLKGEQQP